MQKVPTLRSREMLPVDIVGWGIKFDVLSGTRTQRMGVIRHERMGVKREAKEYYVDSDDPAQKEVILLGEGGLIPGYKFSGVTEPFRVVSVTFHERNNPISRAALARSRIYVPNFSMGYLMKEVYGKQNHRSWINLEGVRQLAGNGYTIELIQRYPTPSSMNTLFDALFVAYKEHVGEDCPLERIGEKIGWNGQKIELRKVPPNLSIEPLVRTAADICDSYP